MIAYLSASFPDNIVVMFMSFLNTCIYSLVTTVFKVFTILTNVTLFDEGTIGEFQKRIYVILGIFMLFKFSFSLLNSIVNPDNLLDKEKGMGKIITRTVIALIMLIMVPTVFKYALEWQNDIALAVPKVIIGKGTKTNELYESDAGEILAATALKAFFKPNTDCGVSEEEAEPIINTPETVSETVALASKLCEGKNKIYMLEFNGFVSLFAGLFMVVYITSYCIDIAIRVIKIGILRILAPIPIISYVDPKSEKNGAFGNWLKECISTYLELFIKLGILYFVIFILGEISSDASLFNIPTNGGVLTTLWVKLFLILGTFFFMGKAADFICNILGIKKPEGSGGFLKGLAGIGAAVGIGAATLSSGLTNYRSTLASQKARGVKQNKGAALASAILGGGVGLATAGKAVAGAKTGKAGAAIAAAYKRNTAYASAAASGATLFGKAGSYAQRALTGETTADRLEREIAQYETKAKNIDAIVGRADDKSKTSDKTIGSSSYNKNGRTISVSGNYQAWTHAFSAAKNQGLSSFQFNGSSYTMEDAENLDYGLMTSNSECYIKNRGFGDKGFEDLVADYEQNNPGQTIDATTTRKGMKDALDIINNQKSSKNRELRAAKANSDASKPK